MPHINNQTLFALPILIFLLWIMISGFSLADAIMDWAG